MLEIFPSLYRQSVSNEITLRENLDKPDRIQGFVLLFMRRLHVPVPAESGLPRTCRGAAGVGR